MLKYDAICQDKLAPALMRFYTGKLENYIEKWSQTFFTSRTVASLRSALSVEVVNVSK